jgi:hypothetical protein
MSITRENSEKAKLEELVRALGKTLHHQCDGETEPCKGIHQAMRRLNMFLANHKNFQGDLSMADVGELFEELVCCQCHELSREHGYDLEEARRRNTQNWHHPDCDMWDSKADYEPIEVPCCTPEDNVHGHKF